MACATFAQSCIMRFFSQSTKHIFSSSPNGHIFSNTALNYVVAKSRFFIFMGCLVAALSVAITNTFATGLYQPEFIHMVIV